MSPIAWRRIRRGMGWACAMLAMVCCFVLLFSAVQPHWYMHKVVRTGSIATHEFGIAFGQLEYQTQTEGFFATGDWPLDSQARWVYAEKPFRLRWLPRWERDFSTIRVAIPLWIPAVVCGAIAALLLHNRTQPGHCPRCRYDLRHLPAGLCPECGTPHTAQPTSA